MTIKPPETLAELDRTAGQMRSAIRNARNQLHEAGRNATDLIAHAYDHAGRTAEETHGFAGQTLTEVQAIDAALGDAYQHIGQIIRQARAASNAVQESVARRRHQARDFKI